MKQTLMGLPLEGYSSRYTEMLHDWERHAFNQHFLYDEVKPVSTPQAVIRNGEVLDTYNRPKWALEQMLELIKRAEKAPNGVGKVWCSDFFTPGLEALPYCRTKFKAYSFLWAQTFDMFDFTQRFMSWMRPWEHCALDIYSKVFVASPILADLIITAVPAAKGKIEVVGLPFNSANVLSRMTGALPPDRLIDVIYSSRLDEEKHPDFYLDLVEARPDLKFAICTGHPSLQGNAVKAIARANKLAVEGRLQLYMNLPRGDYYRLLACSKVQFNCAMQDWTAFTFLEGLTFGCVPLYPNWRDFPTSVGDMRYLYEVGNLENASTALSRLLLDPPKDYDQFRAAQLSYHDQTLEKIAKVIAAD